jgi:hypothetical protein
MTSPNLTLEDISFIASIRNKKLTEKEFARVKQITDKNYAALLKVHKELTQQSNHRDWKSLYPSEFEPHGDIFLPLEQPKNSTLVDALKKQREYKRSLAIQHPVNESERIQKIIHNSRAGQQDDFHLKSI